MARERASQSASVAASQPSASVPNTAAASATSDGGHNRETVDGRKKFQPLTKNELVELFVFRFLEVTGRK